MTWPLFIMLLVGCCAYAFARGGAPERIAAGLQVGAFISDEAIHRHVDGFGYRTIALGSFALDVVLLLTLILLAWRSTRFWPLWVAAWQLAAIAGHSAKAINPGMLPIGYALQEQIWAYPMLVATAFGAWRHQRRLRSGDTDPSWKAQIV